MQELLSVFEDTPTMWACMAERGMLRTLEGGCKVPIAVFSTFESEDKTGEKQRLTLHASVISTDGKQVIKDADDVVLSTRDPKQSAQQALEMGQRLGGKMRLAGGEAILSSIRSDQPYHRAPPPKSSPSSTSQEESR